MASVTTVSSSGCYSLLVLALTANVRGSTDNDNNDNNDDDDGDDDVVSCLWTFSLHLDPDLFVFFLRDAAKKCQKQVWI